MEENLAYHKQESLSSWIELYTGKLLHWACAKCKDDELAKDLVQDTFVVAFEKIESFKGKSEPLTWLFGILNNKINDHFKKTSRIGFDSLQAESLSDEIFLESGHWNKEQTFTEWKEEAHLLDNPSFLKVYERCFENLPLQWRDALFQKYIFGINAKEICQVLNINDTNYWQIIHRAKLVMRNCLEKSWR
ncbi:MAG: sigma-70 family RNA polymerase sigma factor [Bacteroidia bacterium]|nr:sigma-70 family RNA polymerase sigma factor [Bacteroidia bacterium]